MTNLYNEAEVLLRIQSGDEQAFELLYRHYWNDLYSLALAFLKSPALAEDCIQEVFVKLWIRREMILKAKEFRSYFFAVARNEIIDTLRRNRSRVLLRHIDTIEISGGPGQGNPVAEKEISLLIRTSLAALPEKQQQIFLLSREQGLTHAEIARQLQISLKTVANVITLVLNHIRERLASHGYPRLFFILGGMATFF